MIDHTVFLRYPPDLLGEAVLTRLAQDQPLVVDDALFACTTERAVSFIPAGDIEFVGDCQHLLQFVRGRCIPHRRWRSDLERLQVVHFTERCQDRCAGYPVRV